MRVLDGMERLYLPRSGLCERLHIQSNGPWRFCRFRKAIWTTASALYRRCSMCLNICIVRRQDVNGGRTYSNGAESICIQFISDDPQNGCRWSRRRVDRARDCLRVHLLHLPKLEIALKRPIDVEPAVGSMSTCNIRQWRSNRLSSPISTQHSFNILSHFFQ